MGEPIQYIYAALSIIVGDTHACIRGVGVIVRTRELRHFQGEVSFGIGKIWTETPKKGHEVGFLFSEFFGSLLTGILVSIGAPYWHDLLRALTNLRRGKLGTPAAA